MEIIRKRREIDRRSVLGGIGAVSLLSVFSVSTGTRAADKRVVELNLRKRRINGKNRVVRVTQGDVVELRWTSDEPASLHLHGYDLHASPAPGAPSKMSFKAHATGRFPITAHAFSGKHARKGGHSEHVLIYLEVHPR